MAGQHEIAPLPEIAHICRRTSRAPHETCMLCSLAGALRVTQTVDGLKGCHMTLAKSLL